MKGFRVWIEVIPDSSMSKEVAASVSKAAAQMSSLCVLTLSAVAALCEIFGSCDGLSVNWVSCGFKKKAGRRASLNVSIHVDNNMQKLIIYKENHLWHYHCDAYFKKWRDLTGITATGAINFSFKKEKNINRKWAEFDIITFFFGELQGWVAENVKAWRPWIQ